MLVDMTLLAELGKGFLERATMHGFGCVGRIGSRFTGEQKEWMPMPLPEPLQYRQ